MTRRLGRTHVLSVKGSDWKKSSPGPVGGLVWDGGGCDGSGSGSGPFSGSGESRSCGGGEDQCCSVEFQSMVSMGTAQRASGQRQRSGCGPV